MNRLSRRGFLNTSAVAIAGAAALSAKFAEAQASLDQMFDSALTGELFWTQVRQQFVFPEEIVPMNAANLCPSFKSVAEQVSALTADIDRDCSFNNRAKFSPMREQARERIARQLNVSTDEIALVRNTSEANNTIISGLDLKAGDEVVIWQENHPTNHVAWQVRAARQGYSVQIVETPAMLRSPQDLIDAFLEKITDRTRVLALTHVSNVSGIRLPLAELVAAAHARGIYVHVDGAQTWGAMSLDLNALAVDSFTASAHKWYMGPKEVGLLFVKADNIDRIWPLTVASGWGGGVQTRQTGARKFESLGQRDDAALAALGLTASIHDAIGPERIERRIIELSQRLKQGVADADLSLVTPLSEELSFGVCIIAAPDERAGTMADQLYNDFGIAGAATGGLRLCPGIYNTPEHIDRAIAAVRSLLV
jgi:isopenicillin-N epimerase